MRQQLENEFVILEPLDDCHAEELFTIATPSTFQYFLGSPSPWSVEGFQQLIQNRKQDSIPFAVRHKGTGTIVGSSTYLELNEEHRWLEIGYTWYSEPFRGTEVNPACKYLLLKNAFENMDCVRVQLKCDDRNERSKAGILKLGAKFEGVLRNHRILSDGHLRNTAYFSIISSEWPEVCGQLVERLSSFKIK